MFQSVLSYPFLITCINTVFRWVSCKKLIKKRDYKSAIVYDLNVKIALKNKRLFPELSEEYLFFEKFWRVNCFVDTAFPYAKLREPQTKDWYNYPFIYYFIHSDSQERCNFKMQLLTNFTRKQNSVKNHQTPYANISGQSSTSRTGRLCQG